MKLKNIILLALYIAVAMTVAACGDNTGQTPFKYKLVGKSNYLPDGTEIILAHGIYVGHTPGNDQIIAKMTVKNNSFSFTGDANRPEACMLHLPAEGAFMPVIIEKGTIQVFFDKDPNNTFVNGTPLNDSLKMLAHKNRACIAKFQQKLESFHKPPTAGELDAIEDNRNKLMKEIGNIHYACALRNIDNELGYFLTVSSNSFFSQKQRKTLLEKLPTHKHDNPVIREMDIPVDKVIPPFTLQDAKGYSYNVKTLAKQYEITIIDFWASWCGPCMKEMPNLVALNRKYGYKGLGIIGISLDKYKYSWVDAYNAHKATWLQLWDRDGSVADMFGINTIPHTIIVDKNGEVLAQKLRGADLENFVAKRLK